jgi:hypothetical protein
VTVERGPATAPEGDDPREIKSLLWEGDIEEDRVRVVTYDDSYGGEAEAVELLVGDCGWAPLSYGEGADAPAVAEVAAHLAGRVRALEAALGELLAASGDHVGALRRALFEGPCPAATAARHEDARAACERHRLSRQRGRSGVIGQQQVRG